MLSCVSHPITVSLLFVYLPVSKPQQEIPASDLIFPLVCLSRDSNLNVRIARKTITMRLVRADHLIAPRPGSNPRQKIS